MPLKIGRYDIREQIGRGATSTIYLARDDFNNRDVAVKVAQQDIFRDPVNGAKSRKLFMNEAAHAGKLNHPHIVAIYDAGVDEELNYIAMEYVPGGTLAAYTDATRLLPFDKVAEIAFKVAKALEYAQRFGVIHRDIKPANILVAKDTDIKISDFGAALWSNATSTQVMGAVGSPRYMSPEQITGRDITHQSDIYSLGVVMYELLTGKSPVKADNPAALLMAVVKETPPPIAQLRPGVPPALARIVERAMEKDPKRRYPNWSDFTDDLGAIYGSLETQPEEISDTRKFNIMKGLAFFGGFTEAELWEFLHFSQWARFKAGRALVEEGKMGGSFFVLASGEARVYKNERLLGMIRAGEPFGEMPYIYEEPRKRSATVNAISDAMLIKVRADALKDASEDLRLRINRAFLRVMAERLARTDYLLANL